MRQRMYLRKRYQDFKNAGDLLKAIAITMGDKKFNKISLSLSLSLSLFPHFISFFPAVCTQ